MNIREKPIFKQVRSRIDPEQFESPRGFLCRIAGCFSYPMPTWITELAGFERSDDLENSEKVDQLAKALRMDPDLWRSFAYLKVWENKKFSRRQFFGQLIAADRLNYSLPRVCPLCLQERAIWWGIWDIVLVTACPGHRCELIAVCTNCRSRLRWNRPGVEICHCGWDLRLIEAPEAKPEVIAINAAIYRSAGFPIGIGYFDLGNEGFPAELASFALNDLIGLIIACASFTNRDNRVRKPALTDIGTAMALACQAADVLRRWPSGFHNRLRSFLPSPEINLGTVTFCNVYGDLYQYLLDKTQREEFKFLIDAFHEFVALYWPGVVRGQHRLLPEATRERMRWVPAPQAAKLAGLTAAQLTGLVRGGRITGIFVAPPKSRGHVECWLDRDALSQWITSRDADLTKFMTQAQAMRLLGLTAATFRSLTRSGLIGAFKGADRGFPPGVYVSRLDVEQIVMAFSTDACKQTSSNEGELILLREALRRYLGRMGLSIFIRAVIFGALAPLARDSSVAGILGSQFRIEDVKRYSPARPTHSVPSGFITYAVAAARLGTNMEVVRNLVVAGFLPSKRHSTGGIQLLRTQDVERFALNYMTVKSIAARFKVGSRTVSETLRQMGAKLLVIPLPGKGNKLFVRKGPKSDLAIRVLMQRTQQKDG